MVDEGFFVRNSSSLVLVLVRVCFWVWVVFLFARGLSSNFFDSSPYWGMFSGTGECGIMVKFNCFCLYGCLSPKNYITLFNGDASLFLFLPFSFVF